MDFIDFTKSIELLNDAIKSISPKTEMINIYTSLGRILSCDIVAKENSPKKATSAMDGYAVRHEDLQNGRLKIKDLLPAGSDLRVCVSKNECVKTFTGSLMSEGSDTLLPKENVLVKNDEIIIQKPVPKGFAVRPVGEVYAANDILIKKGTRITYAQIAVLCELGMVQIPVNIKPKVAIISTGSEIVDLGEELTKDSQIRSSNHLALHAIIKTLGADPILLGLVKDDKELIKSRFIQGIACADIVVSTGGVSVGDFDFVKEVAKELNGKYIFHGVKIKPGKHVKLLQVQDKFILALPGFTYSALVCFFIYGARIIEKMLGLDYQRRFLKAILDEDYQRRTEFAEFVAVNCRQKDSQLHVDLQGKKQGSSALLTNLLNEAYLLNLPQNAPSPKKGDTCEIIRLI